MSALSSELSKQKLQLEKLKRDISEGLLNAEIAQRTRDAPPGLQFENVAPQEFFVRVVANFEQQVIAVRFLASFFVHRIEATFFLQFRITPEFY